MSRTLSVLVVACFATVLVVRPVTNFAFGALLIAGVIFLLTQGVFLLRNPAQRTPLRAGEGQLYLAFAAFVVVACLSYLLSEDGELGFDKLSRYARFLLICPLLMLFLRVRVEPWALWIGVTLGALLAGVVAVQEAVIFEGGRFEVYTRAEGESYAILFGDLALAWGVMSLAGLRWFSRLHPLAVIIPLLAAVAGLTASILSGTRGGWIALPLMVFLLFYGYWGELSRRLRLITLATLVLLPAAVYLVPTTGVAQRIAEASDEVGAYLAGKREFTSSGLRLEMWRTAWGTFAENPLLGSGLGGYYRELQQRIAAGDVDPSLERFRQPHNEYLLVLSTRGVIGFATLLALFLVPCLIFWRRLTADGPTKDAAIAGLLLVVGYMHFGLTESIFDRALFISIFLFVVAVVASLVLQGRPVAVVTTQKRTTLHEALHSPV